MEQSFYSALFPHNVLPRLRWSGITVFGLTLSYIFLRCQRPYRFISTLRLPLLGLEYNVLLDVQNTFVLRLRRPRGNNDGVPEFTHNFVVSTFPNGNHMFIAGGGTEANEFHGNNQQSYHILRMYQPH